MAQISVIQDIFVQNTQSKGLGSTHENYFRKIEEIAKIYNGYVRNERTYCKTCHMPISAKEIRGLTTKIKCNCEKRQMRRTKRSLKNDKLSRKCKN